jgi:hypothetical protein
MPYTATILYLAFMNQVIQITLSGVSLAYLLLLALHNSMLSSGTRLHARYLHDLPIPSYMLYDNLLKRALDKFFMRTCFPLQVKMSSIYNVLIFCLL